MESHVVCLVEHSELFKRALTSLLHHMGYTTNTSNPAQLSRKRKKPIVILVDVVTAAVTTQELEEEIKQYSGVAPVLLLARDDRIEQLISGLRAGATGFVKQTASLGQLRKALTAVAGGNTWCDTALFKRIMKHLPMITEEQSPRLTNRERQVLTRLSRGESNKEIASHLCLGVQSIKVYVSNLMRKTGTENRSGLTMYAITHGLVGTP